ncbi:Nup53/35/40-type RNA recognition motif-domain-containing protein [Lipomyces chichibuensis]|uniref:Nup53/35/40-type RNA recognition motif-domain-containing protein n=1 Tax=Lipomyces chichibuensis TaxID=1546026 RepID=UPI003343533B
MSLFGATPQPAQSAPFSFGATGGGGMGSATTPGQAGQTNSSTPSFSFSLNSAPGNKSTPPQQQQQPSLFGSGGLMGQQPPPFGSGFGMASQSGSLFSSPFGQQGQPQQQQSTPSQFSSSFGARTGGLTHSQSAFDLSGSMTMSPQQQQQFPGQQQFMPQQQQQQQQQNQIPSTNAFLLTSPPRAPPPAPAWAGAGESRRYVPSHLTHMRYKNSPAGSANGYYTPDRFATSPAPGTPSPGLGSSRSMKPFGGISGSQSTTALTSSESASRVRGPKFGGPSFGVPKPHHTRSSVAQSSSANMSFGEFDELPPTDSIYDAGAASPFAFQLPTTSGAGTNEVSASMLLSPSSNAAQIEDKYTQPSTTPGTPNISGSPTKDQPTSVIVFGFPPDLTHVVVDHFARFGTIMEHLSSGGSGATGEHNIGVSGATPVETGKNWIKITYTTPSAANRALAENGRTLGTMDFFIGCVPHIPSGGSGPYSPAPVTAASGNDVRRSGMRGSGPSLNIHALLSESANEDNGSYANTTSRRRRGDDSVPNLFTPLPQRQPAQQLQDAATQSAKLQAPPLPRMTSVPAGLGKRIDVHGPEGIFKEKERKGGMLSGSATLRGLASIFMGGETAAQEQQKRVKRGAGEDFAGVGKRPQGQESWLGWTTKKTQEFIFGWDDL